MENIEKVTVRIGFTNSNKIPDETEFDLELADAPGVSDEKYAERFIGNLLELFANFCAENHFDRVVVNYIEAVEEEPKNEAV